MPESLPRDSSRRVRREPVSPEDVAALAPAAAAQRANPQLWTERQRRYDLEDQVEDLAREARVTEATHTLELALRQEAAGRPALDATGLPPGVTAAALAASSDFGEKTGLVAVVGDLGTPLRIRAAEAMRGDLGLERWAAPSVVTLAALAAGPTAAELAAAIAANNAVVRQIEKERRAVQAMLDASQEMRGLGVEPFARFSKTMAAQIAEAMRPTTPTAATQAALLGPRDYGMADAARQAALTATRDFGLIGTAALVADLGGWTAREALTGLRAGSAWAPERRAPYTPSQEPSEDERASGIVVPSAQEIVLPDGEPSRQRGGRPPGAKMTRDEFLNRLEAGLTRVGPTRRSHATIRLVARLSGVPVPTVYRYFENADFRWPGGKVGWPIILNVLLERLSTSQAWGDLLSEES